LPFLSQAASAGIMDTNTFFSRTIKQRVKLLKRSGEYIGSISYYGFNIDLYIMNGHYFEAFYNRYTYRLDDVDIMDPKDDRLNRYAAEVNLAELFGKGSASR